MKTIPTIPFLAAAALTAVSAQGASILLGGFDGNQTQNTISPAGPTSNTGVRELRQGYKQDAGAVGEAGARIWTDQATGKELQWSPTQTSTTTGNWGLTNFTTDASTSNDPWVVTQQGASWINFEITNTGSNVLTLDKFHISANRLNATDSPTTLTISLQQNGTFANPPVLSASDLSATGTKDIALSGSTGWNHYEFAFSDMLSDLTLAAGEQATFKIANDAGTQRLYLDNIGISGTIPEPSAALIGLAGLGLLLRRHRN